MKLPEFSVKQPIATLMLFLGVILIGVVSLTKLNIDMFPDIEPPVVSILTAWPGASASHVETEVTQNIENLVNGVNNLDTLTSKSMDNLSIVMCKFDWGSNLNVATSDIRDRLELAKRDLPRDKADTYMRSLGEVKGDVKDILKKMGTPEGITVSFGGEIEEQRKAFRDLALLLLLGIIIVYMVMAALYGNLRDPFIIMFSVPFAGSGVLYAFYLTDITLGVMSFMGIIMLMGIAVKNAIVLLDYIHLLQKRGEPLLEAITHAGKNRLRPILMTTLTTFFGLLPMAISTGVGAEVWNSLGITMLGGLAVSALVTLVLIPTIYYMFEKRKSVYKGKE